MLYLMLDARKDGLELTVFAFGVVACKGWVRAMLVWCCLLFMRYRNKRKKRNFGREVKVILQLLFIFH